MLSPNNLTASAAGKRILNLSRKRWYKSPRMNAIISGVHAEAWGPFAMARCRALYGLARPVCNSMPFSTYFWGRGAAGCRTASCSSPRVLLWLEIMTEVSERSFLSACNVSHA